MLNGGMQAVGTRAIVANTAAQKKSIAAAEAVDVGFESRGSRPWDSALRKATDGFDERERVLALHTIMSLSLVEDKANKQLMWWDATEHSTRDVLLCAATAPQQPPHPSPSLNPKTLT